MNGSRQRRRNASLFEAMSKAPQGVEAPAQAPAIAFWKRVRQTQAPAMMVAEPLTEEEAQAELSAQRAVREEIDRRQRDEQAARDAERASKRQIAQEQKEARQRAKQAAKQARAAARANAESQQASRPIGPTQDEVYYPFLRAMRGRLVVTLNTTTAMMVAAVVAAVGMGGYALGHRLGKGGGVDGGQTRLAGLVPGSTDGDTAQLPLASMVPAAVEKRQKPVVQPPSTPDLKRLLAPRGVEVDKAEVETPSDESGAVRANAPGSLTLDSALNYLQIESFRIGGDETREIVRADLEEVRKYLAERGIRTIAKRRPKGYALFSSEGFPKGPDGASARAAFATRMEALGREYRRLGGRYEFRRCFFVTAEEVAKGQSE